MTCTPYVSVSIPVYVHLCVCTEMVSTFPTIDATYDDLRVLTMAALRERGKVLKLCARMSRMKKAVVICMR